MYPDTLPKEELRDRWFAVEDLLVRLACHFVMSIGRGDGTRIVIRGALNANTDEKRELITALMNPSTFQVQLPGRIWSFVRCVERHNHDVVVQFIDKGRIREWVASDEEDCALARMLTILRAVGF
jgi:hypothetical protein